MKYEINDEVYWTDPDENICNGYGIVMKVKGEVYCLKMDNGEEVEAFKRELS
jgi:hypothetical protein|tara:strand:+ start:429 stop:584 length:156 start_codon:yes stop_codon:yes gene_type:complete